MSQDSSPSDVAQSLAAQVHQHLQSLVAGDEPDVLYEPVRYTLASGGKRLRPVLLLLTANALGRDVTEALPVASSIEVFHNFTLVHDDIMDDDEERRGRPTVHRKWDDGTGILAGDLLFALSYELLTDLPEGVSLRDVHRVFQPMVRELCRGQALDASFEGRSDVTVDEYLSMTSGKTAALLSAALELGAVLGGADASVQDALAAAGHNMGLAFQIQDDLLDFTAPDDQWGRKLGGDLRKGKKTYVTLKMMERASGSALARFETAMGRADLSQDEFEAVRSDMAAAGVFDVVEEAVAAYTRDTEDGIDVLPDSPARDALHWVRRFVMERSH